MYTKHHASDSETGRYFRDLKLGARSVAMLQNPNNQCQLLRLVHVEWQLAMHTMLLSSSTGSIYWDNSHMQTILAYASHMQTILAYACWHMQHGLGCMFQN